MSNRLFTVSCPVIRSARKRSRFVVVLVDLWKWLIAPLLVLWLLYMVVPHAAKGGAVLPRGGPLLAIVWASPEMVVGIMAGLFTLALFCAMRRQAREDEIRRAACDCRICSAAKKRIGIPVSKWANEPGELISDLAKRKVEGAMQQVLEKEMRARLAMNPAPPPTEKIIYAQSNAEVKEVGDNRVSPSFVEQVKEATERAREGKKKQMERATASRLLPLAGLTPPAYRSCVPVEAGPMTAEETAAEIRGAVRDLREIKITLSGLSSTIDDVDFSDAVKAGEGYCAAALKRLWRCLDDMPTAPAFVEKTGLDGTVYRCYSGDQTGGLFCVDVQGERHAVYHPSNPSSAKQMDGFDTLSDKRNFYNPQTGRIEPQTTEAKL